MQRDIHAPMLLILILNSFINKLIYRHKGPKNVQRLLGALLFVQNSQQLKNTEQVVFK